MIAGNALDATCRAGPCVEWDHAAQDNAAIVREFTKFDDQPALAGAFRRIYCCAATLSLVTPPSAPVLIMADLDLQERSIGDLQGRGRRGAFRACRSLPAAG